ncbi:GLUG motif-containing protein [Paenibacillus piri]|uniref:GLUG domain-containing protein n=1 Tax=Paenibacillus piri TaxID=2547395 RepID=A0A4R5KXS8_9BACL|nr:GLUG motif-containing protein [Paenibacillus piri]TDG00882.1 hypothetical protein E1757_04530 [Paenibacillus piri]
MKRFTKFFAIMSILCSMIFTAMPIKSYAAAVSPSGSGTAADPYILKTVDNLEWLSQQVNGGNGNLYVELGNNIDASSLILNPIGSMANPFRGVFDGKGNKISNLRVSNPSTNNVGMFGYTEVGSVIRNLGLESINVTGGNSTGGLVGRSYSSIENCYTTGTVKGSANAFNIGGLAGNNHATISNSHSSANVTGGSNSLRIGGLVGQNAGSPNPLATITNSYATGNVTGQWIIGGLAGENSYFGEINSSTASGGVSGLAEFIGSLAGRSVNGGIYNSSATGTISGGSKNIPGLIGSSKDYLQDATYVKTASDFIYTNADGTATIVGYAGSNTSVNIPSVLEGYNVTAIQDAFVNNTHLNSVTVEDKSINFTESGEAVTSNITIRGYRSSTAQIFATDYSLKFESLDGSSEGGGTENGGNGDGSSGNTDESQKIDITGDVSSTLIIVTVPTSVSFAIKTNSEVNPFVSVPFSVQNESKAPVDVEVLGFQANPDTSAKVVDAKKYSDTDWRKLSASKSEQEIALGLNVDGSTIWSPAEIEGETPNTVVDSIRVDRLGSKEIKLEGKHGMAFKQSKVLGYKMHIRVELAS